jgi:hypothetical protein
MPKPKRRRLAVAAFVVPALDQPFTLSLRQSQEIVVSGFMTLAASSAQNALFCDPLHLLRIHITGKSEHKGGRPIRAAPEEA